MAFDVLRSFHRVPAVITPDGKTETRIHWKPCKAGAKAFPGWHSYGSAVWEPHPEDWIKGPGLQTGPLTYSNGRGYVPPGQEFHGPREWFEEGIPTNVIAELTPESSIGTCGPPDEAIETKGRAIESSGCFVDFPVGTVIRWHFTDKVGRFTTLPDYFDVVAGSFASCIRNFDEIVSHGAEFTELSGSMYIGVYPSNFTFQFASTVIQQSYLLTDPGIWSVSDPSFGQFYGNYNIADPEVIPIPSQFARITTVGGDSVNIAFTLV